MSCKVANWTSYGSLTEHRTHSKKKRKSIRSYSQKWETVGSNGFLKLKKKNSSMCLEHLDSITLVNKYATIFKV